jgi:glycosyltransferase involved in cell wall biosynthesis
MARLTLVVLTKNAASELRNLPYRVTFDELLVVDDNSSDETEQVARQLDARYIARPLLSFGEQRQYADSIATGDWILHLDVDEYPSSALAEAIVAVCRSGATHSVYEVNFRHYFLGRWLRHGGIYPDFKARLYRRGAAHWCTSFPERVDAIATRGRLPGHINHYSTPSLRSRVRKLRRYSTEEARARFERRDRSTIPLAICWAVRTFAGKYMYRGGFLDGWQGLAWSLALSTETFLIHWKTRRLQLEHKSRGPSGS